MAGDDEVIHQVTACQGGRKVLDILYRKSFSVDLDKAEIIELHQVRKSPLLYIYYLGLFKLVVAIFVKLVCYHAGEEFVKDPFHPHTCQALPVKYDPETIEYKAGSTINYNELENRIQAIMKFKKCSWEEAALECNAVVSDELGFRPEVK